MSPPRAKSFSLRFFMAALVVALFSTQIHAQFGGGPMGRGKMGGPPGGDPERKSTDRRSASASDHPVDDMMLKLDNVRYQLQLRPAQEPLWFAYQGKVGALLGDQQRPRLETAHGNALQQIERKIDIVRNRLTAFEEIADAARNLYHGLDTAQQEKADRLLPGTLPIPFSGQGADLPENPGRLQEDSGGRGRPMPR